MLKYAYVQILGEVPFLFLFADYQHYISTAQSGFDEVYQQLSDRFQFDDATFFAVCKACVEDAKEKIWTKKMPQNYQILEDYTNDADFGYEVYAQPKQLLSWDTSYEALEASGLVEAYHTDYGTKYLRFKHPVRINEILIQQLEVYVEGLPANRPVQEYFVDLYDASNTDTSYKELRKQWIDEDLALEDYGYERADQCYLRFEFSSGIEASISYTYDEDYAYDDGSTSLHFYNTRAYSYLLDNKAYEAEMEVSAFLSLPKKLAISTSYMDNDAIKNIPAKVAEWHKGKSGIWIDQPQQKIGFVGVDTALILDLKEIDSFEFLNVLPAKGAGYADFLVRLKSGNAQHVFCEDTYFFDPFAESLQQLTHKKVHIPEADYNC